MKDQIKAAVIGSFIGDSMALGVHWVYEPEEIEEKYGRVETLLKPELMDYHAGKEAGEFTHYGDQAYELLITVSTGNGFEPDSFMSRWRALFKGGYKGYFDHATKKTLEQFGECETYSKCVSHSSDLGGASRIAPLLIIYSSDLEGLQDAAVEQTRLTHNNSLVMEAAAFFAEVTYEVLQGKTPTQAMESAIETSVRKYSNIIALVKAGLVSKSKETNTIVSDFGMGCNVKAALPSTVHILAKYENDFKTAIIENIMSGGDSAARGMLIGMVLGAHLGMNAIPTGWFEGLKRHEELLGYINQTMHIHYFESNIHGNL